MKKRVIKIAALVVLFAAVLVISNVILNRGNDEHLQTAASISTLEMMIRLWIWEMPRYLESHL